MSAQLQFWIFNHVITAKMFRKVTTLCAWEVFFKPNSFHRYFSLSARIIADESTCLQYMLCDHNTPNNNLQRSNS